MIYLGSNSEILIKGAANGHLSYKVWIETHDGCLVKVGLVAPDSTGGASIVTSGWADGNLHQNGEYEESIEAGNNNQKDCLVGIGEGVDIILTKEHVEDLLHSINGLCGEGVVYVVEDEAEGEEGDYDEGDQPTDPVENFRSQSH